MSAPLRTAIVGLGGMGLAHAKAFAPDPDYTVVAGCDPDAAKLAAFREVFKAAAGYRESAEMLAREQPDVVVIATATDSHAALVLEAAAANVRGVFCEKPMAVSPGDARAMVDACARSGTALVVNHQRRTQPPYVTMRRLIEQGAIGTPDLIRGSCAGDVLSDGTHTVDSIRYLAGDAPVTGVTGQIVRDRPDPAAPRSGGFNASGGWRYGHPVETGALAVIEFAGGLRAEMFCGSLQIRGRQYQDLEVIGSTGRLWRAGDRAGNTLLMHDGGSGGYRPVPVEMAPDPGFVIRQFARMIREGAPHPLNGDSALADHEIVTAVYESARLRSRVTIPVAQDRYPLELMIEAGDP